MESKILDDNNRNKVTSVAEFALALRRKIVPLSIWIAICVSMGAIYSFTAKISYSAFATIILESHQNYNQASNLGATSPLQALDVAQAESQIQVIKSERNLSEVFDVLNLSDSGEFKIGKPGLIDLILARKSNENLQANDSIASRARQFRAFSDRVSVRRIGQSYVLEITYQAETPEQAARVANSITMQYIKGQIDVKVAAAMQGTEYLRDRIANLIQEQKIVSDSVKNGKIPSAQLPDADARVIGSALPPLGKSFPKPFLIIGFSAALSLLVGVFSILAINVFDKKIRARSQIERVFNFASVSSIPKYKDLLRRSRLNFKTYGNKDRGLSTLANSLAIRELLSTILLRSGSILYPKCGIVSWRGGVGKTSISRGLCFSASAAGSNILLVDANVDELLSPSDRAIPLETDHQDQGLISAVRWQVCRHNLAGHHHLEEYRLCAESGNIDVGLEKYFDLLRKSFLGRFKEQIIIVDLPALSEVPEARAVLASFDYIVVVVEQDVSTVDEIDEISKLVGRADLGKIKMVLNKV